MKSKFSELSKVVSHALRHEPWVYELELDGEGWVSVDMLLSSIRVLDDKWEKIQEPDLINMIAQTDKARHELAHGKIRATYGHSIPGKLLKIPGIPPDVLYHGTSSNATASIKQMGLLPMSRQYVHLSADRTLAHQVGLRKGRNSIVIIIRALEAYRDAIDFYQGNDFVWLADKIPSDYIEY
jgi:putative RNA 2'-phosphotransferase